ncbi:MAG: hypothetical protein E5W81_07805 [Mesorhizobium sp.]|nr:MAG: hypothetical protein E5W70_26500 [Mesorhizobium sp.]TIX45479.1 MAG: hypothetical protein E5V36_05750 [Mesorhizobium sp.]TKB28981.1 MAG: hypothetical protein E5W69_05965 [Mesorhizobium sp.]TKB88613.1 MAG: hypothetical protein E5W81_07805 [Mesorhizobium sp.]
MWRCELRQLEDLVEHYVGTRSRRYRVISTGLALRALRQVVGMASISDRELENMVADRAVKHGLAVDFDHIRQN